MNAYGLKKKTKQNCMHREKPLPKTIMVQHSETEENERHFAGDIFTGILFNENAFKPIEISLKFPLDSINNKPTLVQIKAWRLTGAKPLSEPIMD